MKRLLMITGAVGLCLTAPAFAQSTTDQEQMNKQRANQPATSAPATPAAPRAANPPQSTTGTQQQPSQNGQAQNQQQPSSTNAQAPSNQNQSGQAQNQQQPAASNPPASSAQAPNNQNQNGQAQNQQKPTNKNTNAQAPANQQPQRSATDRNQPAQNGQAQNRQMQQNNAQQNAQGDRTGSRQSQRDNARSQNRNNDRSSASLNVNINDQQRTRISAVIRSTNVRPVNVNFRIAAGVAVPRNVALHTLPSSIIEVVPQYRGYNYFVTGEQIVIVEPRRKTIVAVLPAGGTARAQAPASSSNRVSFTDQQRDIIRSRSSSIRSPETTGSSASHYLVEEEVPATVELEEFPAEVVTEVPTVRSYRYFRQDNDVIVVDPTQRRVIEVIR